MKYLTMLEALAYCLEKPGVNECQGLNGCGGILKARLSTVGVQEIYSTYGGKSFRWASHAWDILSNFTKIEPEVSWEEEWRTRYANECLTPCGKGIVIGEVILKEVDRRIAEAMRKI